MQVGTAREFKSPCMSCVHVDPRVHVRILDQLHVQAQNYKTTAPRYETSRESGRKQQQLAGHMINASITASIYRALKCVNLSYQS